MACRTPPHSDMNPVLLKPQADHRSQLILHGRPHGLLDGLNFRTRRQSLLPEVLASWQRLKSGCDIVIVEGAASPTEINLRVGDIANMGFACATDGPVVLVGDIDRGGVIASLVGTRAVLDPADAAMIRGFIINRFRGDVALFTNGYRQIKSLSRLARFRHIAMDCRCKPPAGRRRPSYPSAGDSPGHSLSHYLSIIAAHCRFRCVRSPQAGPRHRIQPDPARCAHPGSGRSDPVAGFCRCHA